MIYFDNATTSFPKPRVVVDAIQDYLENGGCSPGRSGHAYARLSEERIDTARKSIARFLGVATHTKITYTYNATYALNMVIKGLLKKGDHVVATCLEHNSVLRPLHKLSMLGIIEYSILGLDADNGLNIANLESMLRPSTKLVIINHASNVTGQLNLVDEAIKIAHKHGVKVLVDISQSAGHVAVDLEKMEADFAVFTGHKALFGLPGIGGLYVKDFKDVDVIVEGGTGNNSSSLFQPELPPHKFEAGTVNYTGIIALARGIKYIEDIGLDVIMAKESALIGLIVDGLKTNPKVTIVAPEYSRIVPIISLCMEGMPANILASMLDNEYRIMTRPGLQCAPLAHKAIGTYPTGTLRVSLSTHNTKDECQTFVRAIREISQRENLL